MQSLSQEDARLLKKKKTRAVVLHLLEMQLTACSSLTCSPLVERPSLQLRWPAFLPSGTAAHDFGQLIYVLDVQGIG